MRKKVVIAKRLVSIFLVFILLISTTGCMFGKSKADKILKYMEKKYDDEFTYVNSYDSGLVSGTKWVMLKSSKHPDWDVRAHYSENNDGKETITDNYLCCKFNDQAYDKFKNMIEKTFNCEFKIDFVSLKEIIDSDTGEISNFNNSTTFEEFINSPYVCLSGKVMLSNEFTYENRSEFEKQLKDSIINENVIMDIWVYLPKEIDEFDKGFDLKLAEDEAIEKVLIMMIKHNEFKTFDWRNVE